MDRQTEDLIRDGYQARREREPVKARLLFSEAVDRSRKDNDPELLARSLKGLGQMDRDLNNAGPAQEAYEEAVAIYRTLDEPLALAHTIRHVGDTARKRRQWDVSSRCYQEALEIYRKHPETEPLDLANAIAGFARLGVDCGNKQEAAKLWREAREIYASLDVNAGVEEAESQLALLASQNV